METEVAGSAQPLALLGGPGKKVPSPGQRHYLRPFRSDIATGHTNDYRGGHRDRDQHAHGSNEAHDRCSSPGVESDSTNPGTGRRRIGAMRVTTTSESVWDYPRPPRVEPDGRRIRVLSSGRTVALTTRSSRVLETSHPPVFYIPPEDIDMTVLSIGERTTFCEYKGQATYWDLASGSHIDSVAWSYESPSPGFGAIKGWLAFYPSKLDCFVGHEQARPQEGDFYGGWVTSEIRGPFKGGPGTFGW